MLDWLGDFLQGVLSSIWGFLGKIIDWIGELGTLVIMLLPNSPFGAIEMPVELMRILGYVNWVLPINEIINITSLWLVAIGTFYIYQAILRITKAIE